MERVSDEAVTGPTLPPPCIVCVCARSQQKGVRVRFAFSRWDLTTEWHLNGTFSLRSSRGGRVTLMTVAATRGKGEKKKNPHLISI